MTINLLKILKTLKDKVRISKKHIDNKRASNGLDQWYHLDCFVDSKAELGFNYKAEEYGGNNLNILFLYNKKI